MTWFWTHFCSPAIVLMIAVCCSPSQYLSDIDIAVTDSLKVLDLKWPIREASKVAWRCNNVAKGQ